MRSQRNILENGSKVTFVRLFPISSIAGEFRAPNNQMEDGEGGLGRLLSLVMLWKDSNPCIGPPAFAAAPVFPSSHLNTDIFFANENDDSGRNLFN